MKQKGQSGVGSVHNNMRDTAIGLAIYRIGRENGNEYLVFVVSTGFNP